MFLSNFHSHFNLCDGKGEAHEYLDRAIELGFVSYGFSAHAPIPGEHSWTLAPENLPLYIDTVNGLKKKYAGKIQVYAGLEIDFIPAVMGPSSPEFTSLGLDFKIGSVHMIKCAYTDRQLAVDGPDEHFLSLFNDTFAGSFRDFSAAYYTLLNDMIAGHRFDILGHLDLIKKKDKKFGYLDESAPWYRTQVLEVLDHAAEKGIIIEVNTGGIARGATDQVYPSEWIIRECFARGIPMMVNADSHDPSKINFYFDESYALLRSCGYRSVRILRDGKWQDVGISG
ncbi:MAG: histidinol-phosphatase [Spirochaetales bacterium]|nr:histidinol-phosphatase [Spirochaetales bacterium]